MKVINLTLTINKLLYYLVVFNFLPLSYRELKNSFGGGKLAQRGRPRIYNSYKEKMRSYRETKKQGGAVRIDCYLPS